MNYINKGIGFINDKLSTIGSKASDGVDGLSKIGSKITNIGTGKSFPNQLQDALDRYGNMNIKNITVCRTPVLGVIQSVINASTGGELEKNIKSQNYDDLYHLFMILTMDDGTKIRMERNQRVNVQINPPEPKECVMVDKQVNVKFNDFINNTVNKIGMAKFNLYNARTNNCQMFLRDLLSSNNLYSKELETFIMQDAEALVFKDNPTLDKVASALTNTAGIISDVRDVYDEAKKNPIVNVVRGLF